MSERDEADALRSGGSASSIEDAMSSIEVSRPLVLLAGGDADLRDHIQRVLSVGYRVRAVADGEEALAALSHGERADLLLTEIVMPRLDGAVRSRAVQAILALAGVPVVLLANRTSDEIDVGDADLDLVDYLMKPFSSRELLARVAVNVEMGRLRRHWRRADETARHTEERLRVALLASGTGTFRWDIATNLIEGDGALNRIFGFPPQEAKRSLDEYLPRIDPDVRQRFIDELARCEREGVDFEIEYRVIRPDGTACWVLDRGKTFRDAEGRPSYMTGTCVDITERKRAEENLQTAQSETARLARQSTLGELAASIAHEINQPLGAIRSNADALLRWLALDPPELMEVRNSARLVVADAHRASEVIKRIRALLAREVPEHAAFDINEAIEEVLLLSRSIRQKSGVALRTDFSTDLPAVLGDRVQLQLLILNLVLNGLEAMDDVSDRPRVISIRSRPDEQDDAFVLVSVADTGTGITPEIAERIYDPFFTTKATGMGMGLSVCRSIIEAHTGRLQASPAAMHGTIFEVTLPTTEGKLP
ncbi:MAG: nodV2 [Rhodospirillales bacterium]|nr:nodV2 [Rhodospirillales bacterium]